MTLFDHEKENWEYIGETNNLYMVSNQGRIKSITKVITTPFGKYDMNPRYLKQQLNHKGYPIVRINIVDHKKTFIVHRLVAKTFIENPFDKPQVNHVDGNKLNNHVSNLEWATNQENMAHAYNNKITVNPFGKEAKNHKYTFTCSKLPEINGMTSMEIAIYFRDVLRLTKSIRTVSCNIRTRNKSFGYEFEKVVVGYDAK